MDNKTINEGLRKIYNFCSEEGYDIVGVFLFGSQNYGVSDENSDLDFKVICKSLPANRDFFSFEQEGKDGILNIVTIKDFVDAINTGYHTWYELLFTEYYLINPDYRTIWESVRTLREQLVRENLEKHLRQEIFYLEEQLDLMELTKDFRHVSNNKRLSYFYRIEFLINNLLAGEEYSYCLRPTEDLKNKILWLKRRSPLTIEECQRQAQEIYQSCKTTVDLFLQDKDFPDTAKSYNRISQLMLNIEEEGNGTI